MEENKTNIGIEKFSPENLEEVSGGTRWMDVAYQQYSYIIRYKIFSPCKKKNVRAHCPQCGRPLEIVNLVFLYDAELEAPYARGNIMCHRCRYEGSPEAWVNSPNNRP